MSAYPTSVRDVAQREIKPRVLTLHVPKDAPRYWMEGDAFSTHLLNAFSLTFPEGESFFVASVRALRDHVKDETLKLQVRGFLAQESFHRREHDAFNEWLRESGIDVDRYYAEVKALLDRPRLEASPLMQLAVTCALEHLTATMAEAWLNTPSMRLNAHESVRPLWTWHAIEELDHKAVAFDVYRAAGGGYALRVVTMLTATGLLIMQVSSMQRRMLAQDKQLTLSNVARGLWKFWGPRGHFTRLIPSYLRYFNPRFHPWQKDDSALIREFEAALKPYFSESTRAA